MGIVFSANRALVANYQEETATIRDILIEPGRPEASVKLAPLTSVEVDKILKKLDSLVMQLANPAIATIVAEEVQAILVAIRMCKTETKEDFMGLLSAGSNLDICWLRPMHIGSSLLATSGSNKGLYAGTNAAVLTWLHNFTATTETDMVPEQTMKEEAVVIHLGAVNPIEDPKLESIKFYLAGIPTPAQSCEFRGIRKSFGSQDVPIVRFEKPIIVGPEKKQQIKVKPYVTGNDKCQLLSLLITKSEDMLLTIVSA